MYELHKTPEFEEWLDEQSLKSRLQVDDRLLRIACEEYFGIHKYLDDHVWELKWANGRRIYYAYISKLKILLLLGGNKNGQGKDITQAKKILRRYTEIAPEKRSKTYET